MTSLDIQVAYVVLYGYSDRSFKRKMNMNKTVCLIAFVLSFVAVSLVASQVPVAAEAAPVAAEPAMGTIAKICNKCSFKSAITKVFGWCKAHPVYLAAGVSATALVVVCLTCPSVKAKIRECLGLESQQSEAKFEPCFVCSQDEDVQLADLDEVRINDDFESKEFEGLGELQV